MADLKLLVTAWNSRPGRGNWNQAADLDGSNSVNLGDLKILVVNWNRSLGDGPLLPQGSQQPLMLAAMASQLDSLDPGTDLVNFKIVAVDPSSGQEVSSIAAAANTQLTVRLFGHCPTSGLWAVGGDIVAGGAAGALDSTGQQFAWKVSKSDQPLWQWTGSDWTQIGTYPYYVQPGNFAGDVPVLTTTTDEETGYVTSYSYDFTDPATCAAQASPVSKSNWFKGGMPGDNGGMTLLGSGQGAILDPNTNFGQSGYALLGSYTVTVLDSSKPVTLSWREAPQDAWTLGLDYGGWFTSGTQGLYTQIGTITPLQINPMSVTPGSVPSFTYEGWAVSLTATAANTGGSSVTYSWSQAGGVPVTDLTVDSSTGNASFTVPTLQSPSDVPLTFDVTASDSYDNTATASVTSNAYIMGDINHNNNVTNSDLNLLVQAWNSTPSDSNWNAAADLNNDRTVNVADMALLSNNWGRSLYISLSMGQIPDYVYEGHQVNLACTATSLRNYFLTYTWSQTNGMYVTLTGGIHSATPSFTVAEGALQYIGDGDVEFTCTVSDGHGGTAAGKVSLEVYMMGDVNHDGVVDSNDSDAVTAAMGSTPSDSNWNAAADLDYDNIITSADQALVTANLDRALADPEEGMMGQSMQRGTSASEAVSGSDAMSLDDALRATGLLNIWLDYLNSQQQSE